MFDCCSCFKSKKGKKVSNNNRNDEKNHVATEKKENIENIKPQQNVKEKQDPARLNLEIKERPMSQGLMKKDILSVVGYRVNPVFTQTIQHSFPSPFIKYKVVPLIDQKKALDKAASDNPLRNVKKDHMIIWDYHGGPNQLFYFKKTGNRYYIINVAKAFTVEPPESSTEDGIQLIANPRNDKPNQLWQIQPTNVNQAYEIKSFCGKYLTADGTHSGSKVVQSSRTGAKNQKWKLIPY